MILLVIDFKSQTLWTLWRSRRSERSRLLLALFLESLSWTICRWPIFASSKSWSMISKTKFWGQASTTRLVLRSPSNRAIYKSTLLVKIRVVAWKLQTYQIIEFMYYDSESLSLSCVVVHFILVEVDCIAAMVDCFHIRRVSWDACGIVGLFWVVTSPSTREKREAAAARGQPERCFLMMTVPFWFLLYHATTSQSKAVSSTRTSSCIIS